MNRRLSLHPHPDFASLATRTIEVELSRHGSSMLALRYLVRGNALLLPALEAPRRTDGLWQRTCFEAFLRGAGESYYEFNFSPSSQWASYSFSGHRAGMADAAEAVPSRIQTKKSDGLFELEAEIALEPLHARLGDVPWYLALSAVIEDKNSVKSYWALAHPAGKPDFHDIACFAEALPGA